MISRQTVVFALVAAPLVVAQAGGQNMTATPACAQAKILAQGIAINIMDQQQELSTVNAIADILKTNTVNMQQFSAAKDSLLTFINNGIAIRQMNQMITPRGNAATAGLAVVANAQLAELGLAMNLTGNPANDGPIVAELQKDFAGGVKKNTENQQMAMKGCT